MTWWRVGSRPTTAARSAIAYRATLDIPRELAQFVAELLAALSWGAENGAATGTRRPRAVPSGHQALGPLAGDLGLRGGDGGGEAGEREAGDEHGEAGSDSARHAGPGHLAEQPDADGHAG